MSATQRILSSLNPTLLCRSPRPAALLSRTFPSHRSLSFVPSSSSSSARHRRSVMPRHQRKGGHGEQKWKEKSPSMTAAPERNIASTVEAVASRLGELDVAAESGGDVHPPQSASNKLSPFSRRRRPFPLSLSPSLSTVCLGAAPLRFAFPCFSQSL